MCACVGVSVSISVCVCDGVSLFPHLDSSGECRPELRLKGHSKEGYVRACPLCIVVYMYMSNAFT